MIRWLIAFLLGYLRIEARGGRIERFLNLAVEEGLVLWNIERLPDRLCATLTIGDFRALRRAARGSGSRVRIRGRRGLPFLALRLRRRPGMVAGGLFCAGFLLWASGHVWIVKVKITGPQNLDPRAVAGVAAEAGLKPGMQKNRLDLQRVGEHIRQRMTEVSWVVIRMQGTRAVIEVVEKASGSRDGLQRCVHLVARKGGVIEQVIPFAGEPAVKRGDVVQPGQLLVECSLRYWSGGRPSVLPGLPLPPRESVARTLVAQGRVMARIRYEEVRAIPLDEEIRVPTGRRQSRWVLNWKEKPIIEFGGRRIPFDRSEERQETYGWSGWRNWRPPVELVKVTADEVRVHRARIPLARALEQAKEQMASRLRWILGPSDRMPAPIGAEAVGHGPDFVRVRVTAETIEEIAVPGAPVIPGP